MQHLDGNGKQRNVRRRNKPTVNHSRSWDAKNWKQHKSVSDLDSFCDDTSLSAVIELQDAAFVEPHSIRGPPALPVRQICPVRQNYRGIIAADVQELMQKDMSDQFSDDFTSGQMTDEAFTRLESSVDSVPVDFRPPGSTKPVRHALKPAFTKPPSMLNYNKFIERAKKETTVLEAERGRSGQKVQAVMASLLRLSMEQHVLELLLHSETHPPC